MLQDRHENDKLFERIISLTNEMDPVLAQIDQLLDDDELCQLIRNDLAKRFPKTELTGRNLTLVEVVIRMLVIKRLYSLSYEQTEYQVQDSLVLLHFCRIYLNDVLDDTTLIRWAGLVQPETLELNNQAALLFFQQRARLRVRVGGLSRCGGAKLGLTGRSAKGDPGTPDQ
jgi:transposase, IS5 family